MTMIPKNTFRHLIAVCGVLSLLLFISCGTTESESFAVGLLLPLTGGAASYGENARKGAQLAVEELAAEHPQIAIELKVEDSRGEAAAGVRAASKLINLDRVHAIVGDVTSGVTLAVAPLVNEARVPLVSPGASSPSVSTAGEYVMRTWPSDVLEASKMAEHLTENGIRSLAVVHINNEYGLAMRQQIERELQRAGGTTTIVTVETFEQGAREMRTQLQRVRRSEAEALYFVGFPEAAIVFGRGYSDVGLALPVFSASAFEDPQIPERMGGVLNGTIYTKPLSESPRAEVFRSAFEERFGEPPGLVADTAYDATALIVAAIVKLQQSATPVTGEGLRSELLGIENYSGASGTLSFEPNGDVFKPVGLFVLRDGGYHPLAEAP